VMRNPLLTQDELAAIEAAVRTAEAQTSGEIFCVVAEESSADLLIPLAWATGAALLAPAILLIAGSEIPAADILRFGAWTGAQSDAAGAARMALIGTLALQALLFFSVMLIASLDPVRRVLTPRSFKRERVRQHAQTQFLARNLHATRERTGVLIYVSFAEHMAELVADEGINARVAAGTWDRAMEALVAGLKREAPAEGFVAAIALCGQVLAEHFPPRPRDNPNELSDSVVMLPGGSS
jgi:putative membrane protein